ncbi:DUF1365 domain-containing protein [Alphaproteobacteria bacterium]|nr:DUF1365 domain-containing protein [Alphaproteobacteria bacterium]
MPACCLVPSIINHTRHGSPSHFLARRGLSIWLDLDNLPAANKLSALFSIGRFNLLSFFEGDYGPNFKSTMPPQSLNSYARKMAAELIPDVTINSVHLLTFPRILGLAFNPVSVYVLRDRDGRDRLYIYEVRNTFGDMHSYIGTVEANGAILESAKLLHVSPFFPLTGEYRLKIKADNDQPIRVLMRYLADGKPQLTATLRGDVEPLTNVGVLKSLVKTGQWPLRPLVSIHLEAAKLWMKKVPFFRRPEPPKVWSKAQEVRRG